MEVLPLNKLDIFSDKETYELLFNASQNDIASVVQNAPVIIIDKNVFSLYNSLLNINIEKTILVDAIEEKKTPEYALSICESLLAKNITRHDTVVVIGGGITQDLVTFATSIVFRGIKWIWLPTTLLAQSDSCIGGKSSLNFKGWKNILGNFYPPFKIYIQSYFLNTLSSDDIRSGIGEILKVHLLSGKENTEWILTKMKDYEIDTNILDEMIYSSLRLKNNILEIDPLDQGLRLKMNYGHSFGHALESATNFLIPHGIAVTIGLDMANYIALKINKLSQYEFDKLHSLLANNLTDKDFVDFDFDDFINALKKDKKNDNMNYKFIIPVSFGEVELTSFPKNESTEALLREYISKYYLLDRK